MLRLRGLSRRFGGLVALDDVDLDIPPGTCHALIGPNGAGKSTLVNLVAGALRPSRGRVFFDGRDITGVSATRRARAGIARTFQHPAIFSRLSVAQNLSLATAGRRDHSGWPDLMAGAGLAEYATTAAGDLPYGLQRRLELAMALAGQPRLLLLDEPSAGLDPDEIARLIREIRNLNGRSTVLLVDHNLDLVWTLADTVSVLHHGRLLATGASAEVRANPAVQDAYLSAGAGPVLGGSSGNCGSGPALLHVGGLTAGYRGAPVVAGVEFEVREGESVAILGRNGAGKTTTLSAVAGLLPARPPSVVLLDGQPLPVHRPHLPARAGVAIVPQGRRLFGSLTVTEHLVCAQAAHRSVANGSGRPMWTIDRIFDLLPALAARAKQKARRLSGGEQQMLGLARALVTNPRLLILDEPSEGLAPGIIAQLTETLSKLVADGMAILIAEQNLSLATAIADRLIVLDRGRVALTTSAAELAEPTGQARVSALLGVGDEASLD